MEVQRKFERIRMKKYNRKYFKKGNFDIGKLKQRFQEIKGNMDKPQRVVWFRPDEAKLGLWKEPNLFSSIDFDGLEDIDHSSQLIKSISPKRQQKLKKTKHSYNIIPKASQMNSTKDSELCHLAKAIKTCDIGLKSMQRKIKSVSKLSPMILRQSRGCFSPSPSKRKKLDFYTRSPSSPNFENRGYGVNKLMKSSRKRLFSKRSSLRKKPTLKDMMQKKWSKCTGWDGRHPYSIACFDKKATERYSSFCKSST
ncbi:unnamed protein product [Moneuplotes crassus]|uniref:Uncharacterized protein n=1 Tax=Euplotes crassus TaxID=5936 RepID=A0AAD1X8E0_EUPCR|nr:unnamed protein product [Moneuplotes crassus]